MGYRNNPKRDKQLQKSRKLAEASGKPFIDPTVVFGRASGDDIQYYSPEMLAATAAHTAAQLAHWKKNQPYIGISQVEGVNPRDVQVSVLTVIGRNMPFLYDSVMGEVTSSYRNLYLAVHPIMVSDASAPGGYRLADPETDAPEDNISVIQLHIAPATAQAADILEEKIRFVLSQVQSAYGDWKPMLAKLDEALEELKARGSSRRKSERNEAVAFLEWLRNDNFTFLGMRDYS
jgi:glutamate dehydrogenase